MTKLSIGLFWYRYFVCCSTSGAVDVRYMALQESHVRPPNHDLLEKLALNTAFHQTT